MCGIVGIAGPGITKDDLKVFTDLMRISTLRGVDGTGIFQGRFDDTTATYLIEKKPWEVNMFFRYQSSKAGNPLLLNSTLDNVFIGHTRWATTGPMDDNGCHPYKVGNIIGVHNGTMEDTRYIHKDKTDSEMLYEDITQRGLKAVLESADPDSAFALSYFDMTTQTLTFARNIQRPLYGMVHKSRKVLYWASEAEFLTCATDRRDVAVGKPFYFATNKIYSIKLDDIDRDGVIVLTTEDFRVRTKKKKQDTASYSRGYSNILWPDNQDNQAPFLTEAQENAVKLTKSQRKAKKFQERMAAQKAVSDKMKASNVSLANVTFLNFPDDGGSFAKKTHCSKIATEKCIACQKELKLIDQYFAEKATTKEGEKIFECRECTNLAKSLQNAVEHVTIN